MDAFYSAVAVLAMGSPFLAIVVILIYYYLFRAPCWNRRRSGSRNRSSSSCGGIGTVVLGLTLIYRPRILYAVEAQQRQIEDVDEDDNGGPDTPLKHLMRQLRRIRRGEEVETLFLRRE